MSSKITTDSLVALRTKLHSDYSRNIAVKLAIDDGVTVDPILLNETISFYLRPNEDQLDRSKMWLEAYHMAVKAGLQESCLIVSILSLDEDPTVSSQPDWISGVDYLCFLKALEREGITAYSALLEEKVVDYYRRKKFFGLGFEFLAERQLVKYYDEFFEPAIAESRRNNGHSPCYPKMVGLCQLKGDQVRLDQILDEALAYYKQTSKDSYLSWFIKFLRQERGMEAARSLLDCTFKNAQQQPRIYDQISALTGLTQVSEDVLKETGLFEAVYHQLAECELAHYQEDKASGTWKAKPDFLNQIIWRAIEHARKLGDLVWAKQLAGMISEEVQKSLHYREETRRYREAAKTTCTPEELYQEALQHYESTGKNWDATLLARDHKDIDNEIKYLLRDKHYYSALLLLKDHAPKTEVDRVYQEAVAHEYSRKRMIGAGIIEELMGNYAKAIACYAQGDSGNRQIDRAAALAEKVGMQEEATKLYVTAVSQGFWECLPKIKSTPEYAKYAQEAESLIREEEAERFFSHAADLAKALEDPVRARVYQETAVHFESQANAY